MNVRRSALSCRPADAPPGGAPAGPPSCSWALTLGLLQVRRLGWKRTALTHSSRAPAGSSTRSRAFSSKLLRQDKYCALWGQDNAGTDVLELGCRLLEVLLPAHARARGPVVVVCGCAARGLTHVMRRSGAAGAARGWAGGAGSIGEWVSCVLITLAGGYEGRLRAAR